MEPGPGGARPGCSANLNRTGLSLAGACRSLTAGERQLRAANGMATRERTPNPLRLWPRPAVDRCAGSHGWPRNRGSWTRSTRDSPSPQAGQDGLARNARTGSAAAWRRAVCRADEFGSQARQRFQHRRLDDLPTLRKGRPCGIQRRLGAAARFELAPDSCRRSLRVQVGLPKSSYLTRNEPLGPSERTGWGCGNCDGHEGGIGDSPLAWSSSAVLPTPCAPIALSGLALAGRAMHPAGGRFERSSISEADLGSRVRASRARQRSQAARANSWNLWVGNVGRDALSIPITRLLDECGPCSPVRKIFSWTSTRSGRPTRL